MDGPEPSRRGEFNFSLLTLLVLVTALGTLIYLNCLDHRPLDWQSGHPRGWPVAFFYTWYVTGVEIRPWGAAIDGTVAILIVCAIVALDQQLRRR